MMKRQKTMTEPPGKCRRWRQQSVAVRHSHLAHLKTHLILPLTDHKFYRLLAGKSSTIFLDKLTVYL